MPVTKKQFFNFFRFIVPVFLLVFTSGCGGYPDGPYSPDTDDAASGPWEEVLAGDSGYPDNVYLTAVLDWEFGQVGEVRVSDSPDYYNSERYPLDSTAEGACGPPEGSVAVWSSKADMTVLGEGGWGIWQFDADWVIVDGEGDDFVTFSNHNLLSGVADGSWNELAYVWVAETYDPDNPEGTVWYKSSAETYVVNTSPGTINDNYDWSEVSGLHGNNHTWANFRDEIEAEELDSNERYQEVTDSEGNQVYVSRYFSPNPDDPGYESYPYIGGDYFDLADFYTVNESNSSWPDGESSWPSNGKMRYIRFEDAPEALDGQDCRPVWMTGARIMAAMGINVEEAP